MWFQWTLQVLFCLGRQRRVRAVCRNSSFWTFCFHLLNRIKHWIKWVELVSPNQKWLKRLFTFCHVRSRLLVVYFAVWKLADISFDLMRIFFHILLVRKFEEAIFFSIRFFACLGKLSPKFRLVVVRTLRNIDRIFSNISTKLCSYTSSIVPFPASLLCHSHDLLISAC